MSKRLDLFVGFLVTVLWGANFAVIELGLRDLDPFILTFLRFTFCAFPLVFFIKKPEGISLISIALYGVFLVSGYGGSLILLCLMDCLLDFHLYSFSLVHFSRSF
ncbi:EamA family transporter [Salmonella enterica]|uniref:EamA family transporter n=1 Tax=Salmonella enterica subsp. arizonae serovar 48:z4,z24:- TaxID=1967584 RepID=A0A739C4N8_SALER|nr:hypothetical protein [Salmonella enterica]EAN8390315.1 hypothetical protein [Salmonella enterica subsp. arizonae serovar 13,23:gz51:-]EAN8610929.1 hypothetical protein [Salmonella enterica subsp. arizonae serovar 48:z4,z24:-]EAO5936216.1 hypothetical protein [Salmonella enterica subsp. houtenae serovar 48:g,z51:-]EAW3051757.1 hypothetical protein [Salmonella enterica subsp. enterica]EBF3612969.1 hypothetical protein [Salmonella enterica subsp. arizonae serovar [1],13,23:g,z51:-]ECL5967551.